VKKVLTDGTVLLASRHSGDHFLTKIWCCVYDVSNIEAVSTWIIWSGINSTWYVLEPIHKKMSISDISI